MTAHAKLSPSSAVRWMTCPGSVALCEGLTDAGSSFAAEGTAAHYMAEKILAGTPTDILVGMRADNGVVMAADMLQDVLKYTNYVQDVVASTGGTLLIEERLSIGELTGEADAYGTSDVVILAGSELIIVDLKFGMGEAVMADNNPQLQIYALAALNEYSLAHDFQTVRMVIHQPRLNSVSEWVQSVDDLLLFGESVKVAAAATQDPQATLNPTTKGCRWCKAKATCPALLAEVTDTFEAVDPDDVATDDLSMAMSKVDLIEGWCKAVRAEVERRLLDGRSVDGFKLVQGRRGSRAWTNAEEAEALLKAMNVKRDLMYEQKFISPTTADKLAKDGSIGPRQWPRVLELITQSDGKPSVAPVTDKRPALVVDEFQPVSLT